MKYNEFLDKVFKNLEEVGMDTSGLIIDHVAFRCKTKEEYDRMLKELGDGELLDVAIIRNRPIAIIKLNQSIEYKGFKIPYFELMAPAEGDSRSGLDHIEVVVEDLDVFKAKYPKLNFEYKDRKINPELVLKFPNNANVKFHPKDIATVIKLQKETGEL